MPPDVTNRAGREREGSRGGGATVTTTNLSCSRTLHRFGLIDPLILLFQPTQLIPPEPVLVMVVPWNLSQPGTFLPVNRTAMPCQTATVSHLEMAIVIWSEVAVVSVMQAPPTYITGKIKQQVRVSIFKWIKLKSMISDYQFASNIASGVQCFKITSWNVLINQYFSWNLKMLIYQVTVWQAIDVKYKTKTFVDSDIFLLITARKRSLGQGYVFTGVCDSVHGGHAWLLGACMVARGVCMVVGGHVWLLGDMHGCRGAMSGCRGACVVARGHA